MQIISKWILLLMLNTVIATAVTAEPSKEALEKWFNDDSQTHPIDLVEQKSNTGQLVFLAKPPTDLATHSAHHLTITPDSINTGWISIEQCHKNLDAMTAVEVVYRYQQMRNLKIQTTQHIGKAWIEGQSIQLTDVKKGAELCAQLEARIFMQREKGKYFLLNGPFERRFFDSYFPMQVSLSVTYPQNQLRYKSIQPARQKGFKVTTSKNKIDINTWFKGKLVMRIQFESK